ncbi:MULTISPECIES: DUF2294 domain-containing protein [Exiguobacterium]|jgi:uncharacterized protein YbcI|uniref:Na+-translocating membrane potential-generating system MpsC domain-containing protein n=2 Tax=Exiguobacterium TaxID=33986 RepID=U1LJ62_9BACL|nr:MULTISPECIES: DUF2294 domain-containing protein [Exiguobacterium]ERG67508.1 hypothetical protein M467_09475 [Exiguobacterium chiriqhucha RW-2]MDL5377892.1 DUF2294 domain-containing protein [Exiguobacterium mexicanum]TCI71437.1 DUF2294 domain-containing protein [Exiguobacterium sp. IPCI3]TCI81415.1 DUF2294 domain-containing protein [Exiguobacterium sp. IPCH1]TCI82612.1 DUF2294 domain-containing protein [Exiguobacterium sp. IPBC4]
MPKKGQLEMELSARITQWEKEYLGRGSLTCKADLLRDLAIVTLQGVLTPAEYELAAKSAGREQLKKYRNNLVESGRPQLEAIVHDVLGRRLVSLHTDISTKTGERLIVFRLDAPWENGIDKP